MKKQPKKVDCVLNFSCKLLKVGKAVQHDA